MVEWFSLPNNLKIQYTYDHLERISGMTVMSNSENYTYAGSIYEYSSGNGSNTTSDTIDKVTLRMTNTQFSYVYDDCNNITEIYKNNSLIRKYSYDDLQQMTKEVIIEPGATTGTQYDYVYDLHGNILSKTESTYTVATGATSGSATTQYNYGDNTWGDLLTSYGDLTFTYDEIGNLVSRHREGISSAYYFNWGKGRQLESLSYGTSAESATTVVEHEYNSDGVRISRTFNAGGLEYIVDGDRILKQVGCGIGVLQTLAFYYDAQGEIIGFNYNGSDYYYGKNVQGDVVELYNRWYLIATYEYDAWGNLLGIKDANGNIIPDDINSTNVASINPIRYRGYYYDIEKGMYYLNSRYYWPKLGRFINADSQINTSLGFLGFNQFSYCLNTPVNMVDYGGDKPGDLFDTMDEAARDFAEYISETSIKVDREYASYIYTKTVWETKTVTYYNPNLFGNNLLSRLWNYIFRGGISKTVEKRVQVTKYTYVKPAKGTAHSSTIPTNWFGIHKQVALLHTHGAYSPGYKNDTFSSADKSLSNREKMPIYVSTPLGTLRKYDPSYGTDIVLYDDLPFDSNHPRRQ